jgi:hypothetical protein
LLTHYAREGGGGQGMHRYTTNMLSNEVFDKATFNRVNICTNQNETLMKQIQNSQKSIGKSMPAYKFYNSQEKNPRTKCLKTFAKSF